MSTCRAIIALFCLSLAAVGVAAPVANGDFEDGLTGWDVQGKATQSKDKPAQGKGALSLQVEGAAPAWAVSAPLADAAAGQLVTLSFSIRRSQGLATLALNLVPAPLATYETAIWEAQAPADASWHRVSLLLKVPPLGGAAPRLAFGALGQPGAWQVDEITTEPGALTPVGPLDLLGEELKTEVLPENWEPAGTLDATAREIANETELFINVNGIEIGVRPTFTCTRGYRDGMLFFAVNRGQLEKDLLIKIAAPPGVIAPTWTVPIKGSGTTRFHSVIQCLRQGEFWIKLTCESAGQKASLPIRVTTLRQYPVVGTVWRDEVDAAKLRVLQQLPVDLQVLAGIPDQAALEPMANQVKPLGLEYMIAPLAGSLNTTQYLAALTQLCGKLSPSYWLPYAVDEAPAAASAAPQLVPVLRKQQAAAGVFAAPLQLARDWTKDRLVPTKPAALSVERTAGLASITCRLPKLAPACVLSEKLDGKAEALSGAFTATVKQTDLSGMRGLLQERRIMLPMFVDELQAATSGDARLDALQLARTMTNTFYQGSTGLLLKPDRDADNAFSPLPATAADGKPEPVAAVLRLMSEALAGCEPLVALADTEEASTGTATPVTYRPFRRGGEGIVVLWNNTSAPRDVTLEFRSEPLASSRLLLTYADQFVVQRWDPIMRFSEEAFKRRQPAVFVRLDPLQVQVHSFRLLNPSPGWLRSVSQTTVFVPREEAPTPNGKDERPWWRDMLKGRQQIN